MSRHLVIAVQTALLALAMPASAQHHAGTAEGPRTLHDFLELARSANPSVHAQAADVRAARARSGVVGGYPDPLLMYGYYLTPDEMQGRQELELIQPVPFPGKRGLRSGIASYQADMTAGEARAFVLDVELAVAGSFYEYVRTTEVEHVLHEERKLVVRMRDVAQVRYAAGTAAQQDVLKLDLALSQVDDELTMVEHDADMARVRLNELTGRAPHAPLPAPEWFMPDASAAEAAADADSALAHRPEVSSAHADVARTEAMYSLARREYIPDFMLGVMFEFGGEMDGMWELRAGIELPIWLGKRRAAVREAEAMREAAGHRLDAQQLRVRRDVEHALHGVYSASERLNRFESLIMPQAEQTFQSSQEGYRAGNVDFMDYLDSERTLLALRREYYAVVAELGTQVATLERAMGRKIGKETP